MWTDFQNYFTFWFTNKFSTYRHKDFHLTCDMLLHYLVKVDNPKMLLILTAYSTNCLHVPEDTLNTWFLTVVRQTVSRLLTLSDWLIFEVSLSDDVSNQQLNVVTWTLLHHGDFLTVIIFAPSWFFLGYTSCVVHIIAILLWQVT